MTMDSGKKRIGFFARYLSAWVALCIVAGVLLGRFVPAVPAFLGRLEYARVSLPIAALIWLMIFPMMLKVDFRSIVDAGKRPKGLVVTLVVNWLVKPFTMYAIAWFFLKVAFARLIPGPLSTEYLAGAVLLGAAPCTAMVFVWSYLSDGDPAYTVVQVAINDIVILFAFTPIVALLLGGTEARVPLDTLLISVILFVALPLIAGYAVRSHLVKRRGKAWFENVFCKRFDGITELGLLLTLVLIFSFQGQTIIANPFSIALIAVPLVIQTFMIFLIGYGWAKAWKVPYEVAAPAGMIGASNFFELAVAVAVSVYGVSSGATLATVVGVLVEVPVMLTLVRIARATRRYFPSQGPGEPSGDSSAT
ncbi:MAG: ACR3 family arsenite efflux transporter [Spirochaetes bacterium]|nr:ACR3 family arsenite efflux transporter [Spirochaetota bacterium]MBU1081102.1 ACR3 family arsenite efflux transporter [Spirochaetota bacterium]